MIHLVPYVFVALIYLPAVFWGTLGVLAFWDSVKPPRFWHVVIATVVAAFLPLLGFFLNKFGYQPGALDAGNRLRLAFGDAFVSYLPILVPSVLWTLQRPGTDGQLALGARVARYVLITYAIFVTLVLPIVLFVFVLLRQSA